MSATAVPAAVVLASGSTDAGPIGLGVILLLCIASYFLFKSMSKHMRNVRDNFPGQVDPPTGPVRPTRPVRPSRPDPRAISPLPVNRSAATPPSGASADEQPAQRDQREQHTDAAQQPPPLDGGRGEPSG